MCTVSPWLGAGPGEGLVDAERPQAAVGLVERLDVGEVGQRHGALGLPPDHLQARRRRRARCGSPRPPAGARRRRRARAARPAPRARPRPCGPRSGRSPAPVTAAMRWPVERRRRRRPGRPGSPPRRGAARAGRAGSRPARPGGSAPAPPGVCSASGDRSRRSTSTRARSTWRRNWWPRPRPSLAPSIRPGRSATTNSVSSSSRTTPRFGSSVVNG